MKYVLVNIDDNGNTVIGAFDTEDEARDVAHLSRMYCFIRQGTTIKAVYLDGEDRTAEFIDDF